MADTTLLFKVAIGFDPDRGYAAVVHDCLDNKEKGIKGNSIRQLCRRIHEAICQEEQHKRRFPLEHERSRIVIS